MDSNEKVHAILFSGDEITWQSILYDLINREELDPWDVDVSLITRKYIEMIRILKEHDFRLSGKVILAAALLLKIKSKKWMREDMANLDRLFSSAEEEMESLLDDIEDEYTPKEKVEAELIPRTPLPRKRKVSVYDLVNALEKALEVKHRRVLRDMPIFNVMPPKKSKDISLVIKEFYRMIKQLFIEQKKERVTFSSLLPSEGKEDKVYTFIPLLHLSNQQKINLSQQQQFGEIEITLHQDKQDEKMAPAE